MTTAPDSSRRALLTGRPQSDAPLRPPWALAENEFLEACTRCGACLEHCPGHVLVRGAGGFPEFDPRRGECTFCGDCVRVCEPRALDRELATLPWVHRAVVGDACFARRGIVCSSCRDACPERAIAFDPARPVPTPVIDTEQCSGCGACIGVCPASAIDLRSPAVETV
jgi:ferredoxin-type protein NapF